MHKVVNFSLGLVVIFILGFYGCKKENSQIGLNVQPGGDRIYIENDTLIDFRSYIKLDDSVSTSGLTYNLLGSYNDPVFGRTRADLVTQFNLSSNNVDFQAQLDTIPVFANSLVLYLNFIDLYGMGTEPLTFTIYRIHEDLDDSITYYSNYEFTNSYEEVGSFTFTPTFDANGEFVDTLLEIELDIALANELLLADTANYVDDEAFTNLFQGLLISSGETENGGLLTTNLITSLSDSKLTLNYNDTYSFNFLISTSTTRFSIFDHYNYAGSVFENMIDDVPDSLLFIQAGGGVHSEIVFENYSHWKDSSIAVLKAELIFSVSDSYLEDVDFFPTISRLLFMVDQGDNTFSLPTDYLIDNSEGKLYFGGYFDEETMEYRFNITRYFQKLIEGEISNDRIKLFPYSTKIIGNKVVLDNGFDQNNIRLSLTYSKL